MFLIYISPTTKMQRIFYECIDHLLFLFGEMLYSHSLPISELGRLTFCHWIVGFLSYMLDVNHSSNV
jgi:hypothetical protein